LIGRDADLGALRQLVLQTDGRLVTVTGAGGCGKTSLALHVARGLVDHFPDGVWWIELAPVSDAGLAPQVVATALGLRDDAGQLLLERLCASLAKQDVLLVLDNCEHVIGACAELAEVLLGASSRLRLLATSREPLRVVGERTWRVPSLVIPDPRAVARPTELAKCTAVQLFVDRAIAAESGFALTPENARAVAAVTARLEGIPLAIELAAPWVRVLGVEQLHARLDTILRSPLGASRAEVGRHRTVWATLDWSWALLTEPQKALLRRLSVFAGGWTLETAEAVCAGGVVDGTEVLKVLTDLVDRSLVEVRDLGGYARYWLLEPIRLFANEQLAASHELLSTRRAHAAAFVDLAERHSTPAFVVGRAYRSTAVQRRAVLERELDNFRAALGWLEKAGPPDDGLRLTAAIGELWLTRGYHAEGRRWSASFLDGPHMDANRAAAAKALRESGSLAYQQGELDVAFMFLNRALALYRALPNADDKVAGALDRLGLVFRARGEYARAQATFEEALALARRFGPPWVAIQALYHLGLVAYSRMDWATARGWYGQCLELTEAAHESLFIAFALHGLALIAHHSGDYTRATELFERALTVRREAGDRASLPAALVGLGQVLLEVGELSQARSLMEESFTLSLELADRQGVARALEGFGALASAANTPESAWRLMGKAAAFRQANRIPIQPPAKALLDRVLAPSREALDERTISSLSAAGAWMSIEDALALARSLNVASTRRGDPRVDASVSSQPAVSRLTRRQTEVLCLVTQGKTDKQIALQLCLSEKTVGRHLENIYARLGVSSRAAATLIAARAGLVGHVTNAP
jgi:predicted ATPase/DNA-binding CsgD family transcriptional regulator